MIGLTYTSPVSIVDMTLGQSCADLQLHVLRQLIIAVEQRVVGFFGRKSLLPGVGDVLDHLGSDASPR